MKSAIRSLVVALLLVAPLAQAAPRVTMLPSKAKGSVLIKVEGAGQTQRVTVPWGVAHQLAFAAAYQGGLKVSTASDNFTGGMLRLMAGQGPDMIILDRMRRGGPNGQSGAAALRFQRGLGSRAFYIGRTRDGVMIDQLQFVGRSGPSRQGAILMDPYSLGANERDVLDGMSPLWYSRPTNKVTSDLAAPLRPFAPYSAPSLVTARTAKLVVKLPLGVD